MADAKPQTEWPANPLDEEIAEEAAREAAEAAAEDENEAELIADPAGLETQASDLFYRATLGKQVKGELLNPDTATRIIMTKAHHEAAVALELLLRADLDTTAGIAEAKRVQSEALRFMDMAKWLTETMAAGEQAAAQIKEKGNG